MPDSASALAQASEGRGSKTLDRGLRLLEAVATTRQGLTVGELSERLGAHRAVIYRLLETLIEHGLISKGASSRYQLGVGLVELTRNMLSGLRDVAATQLELIAEEFGVTAYLTVADGDEAIVVSALEPRNTNMHVAYRTGLRHPLDRGASGIALLSSLPAQTGERPEIGEARERGYATSVGELQPGAHAVAVALPAERHREQACIGVVAMAPLDSELLGSRLLQAAAAIEQMRD